MQVENISNTRQNFNGRAYTILSGSAHKAAKTAIGQINSMKMMKNANFNLYLCNSTFNTRYVLVAAKNREDVFFTHKHIDAILVKKNVTSIIETAKDILVTQTKKEVKPKSKPLIFRMIQSISNKCKKVWNKYWDNYYDLIEKWGNY